MPGMIDELLQIHPDDNVAVALADLPRGRTINRNSGRLFLREDVTRGHKVALADIQAGEDIIKYGASIGRASTAIPAGAHVHRHNLATALEGAQTYGYHPCPAATRTTSTSGTFSGYVRANGAVGTRNEIWVISTVGCVNRVAERFAARASALHVSGTLEGIYALTHPYGCSQSGEDHRATQRILAGLVNHPNAGGVLLVGLGCENNNLTSFLPCLGEIDPSRVRWLDCQHEHDEIEAGLARIAELVPCACGAVRQEVSLSRLVVGLKCGGSDGLSGITANPLVGLLADRLVAAGGTVLLTEIPEMFGAEQRLMDRCADRTVSDKLVAAVNDFKAYFGRHGQPVYDNPSPGNHEGGITTLEEKSLGCIEKGGSSSVVDVFPYGAAVTLPGLNILCGPGNDIVSETALVAAGAQLLLFTTGRGTPLGAPVPTVKIASNSALARHKPHWIDFDAGVLLEGVPLSTLCDALMEKAVEIAGGQCRAVHEMEGDRQIAIWKDGVTL